MSSKRKKKPAPKNPAPKQSPPAVGLPDAQQAFAKGDLLQSQRLAEAALKNARDLPTQQALRSLLAEVYLRLAGTQALPSARLPLLTQALAHAPAQPRLHYQRGLTLWRLGDFAGAAREFDQVAQAEPARPGLPVLRQLGNLATNRPVQTDGLVPDAANTVALLQGVRNNETRAALLARCAGQPLLGDDPTAWTALLQMIADPKAAPAVVRQPGLPSGAVPPPHPVLRYYAGVAALRQGDLGAAQAAWDAAAHMLTTAWLTENRLAARRTQAIALAQAQHWQAVVDLYEATRQELGTDALDPGLNETAGVAYFHLGHTAAQSNQWHAAVVHFRAADALLKSRQLSQNLALAEEAMQEWAAAAEAWREMIRRRPRSQDHADALSDSQVAAIWERAAHCYLEAGISLEAIVCLKNAIKYVLANYDLRIVLVDVLMNDDRREAAENELERILEENATFVPALTRLGVLYMGRWDRDALPIWRRVLAQEPQNQEAREALANLYIERALDDDTGQGRFPGRMTPRKQIELLETGLREAPNHPMLLLALGTKYSEQKKPDKARQYLKLAAQYAPGDPGVLGAVLHQLLHSDGGALVQELLPKVRAIAGLRPIFWIEQGEHALECELGIEWAGLFGDEAIALSAPMRGADSPATVLASLFESAFNNDAGTLAARYEQRVRSAYAATGAVEYIDAVHAFDPDARKNTRALSLLKSAQAKALKAGESGLAELAADLSNFIRNPKPPGFFGSGPGSLLEQFMNMDEEMLDAFRKIL